MCTAKTKHTLRKKQISERGKSCLEIDSPSFGGARPLRVFLFLRGLFEQASSSLEKLMEDIRAEQACSFGRFSLMPATVISFGRGYIESVPQNILINIVLSYTLLIHHRKKRKAALF